MKKKGVDRYSLFALLYGTRKVTPQLKSTVTVGITETFSALFHLQNPLFCTDFIYVNRARLKYVLCRFLVKNDLGPEIYVKWLSP